MHALDLVRLRPLMDRSEGRPEIAVAIIDGPIALDHPDLARAAVREIPGDIQATSGQRSSAACTHGTFVAGLLFARRGSSAAAICPGCTLMVRPIYLDAESSDGQMPTSTPEALAGAVFSCVAAGARIINLSSALTRSGASGERSLNDALNYAANRGTIVVAAAGNQGNVSSSVITRHPWVIPVGACDAGGRPMSASNWGRSIARHGVRAPGVDITSLGTTKQLQTGGGTSAAAPFVTGAAALLWSEFPKASAALIRWAILQAGTSRTATIIPQLLDASASHAALSQAQAGRMAS